MYYDYSICFKRTNGLVPEKAGGRAGLFNLIPRRLYKIEVDVINYILRII